MFLAPKASYCGYLLTIYEPFFNSYQKSRQFNSDELNKSNFLKVKTHLSARAILLIFFYEDLINIVTYT